MSLPALDFRDPTLVARIAAYSVVISASAGSGKTFTLATLVLGFLGQGGRASEVLATTFGREAASDLRRRLLAPLDDLSLWSEDRWQAALGALAEGWSNWDAWWDANHHDQRGEIAQAVPLWLSGEAPPTWMASPRAAREHWIRTRREAEMLTATTVHGLALSVLRADGQGSEGLLEAKTPALVRLLRAAGREVLNLPADHPDAVAARWLWAWCEGRTQSETRWDMLAGDFDAHLDAQGTWRAATDTKGPRRALLDGGRRLLERYSSFLADPDRAGALTTKGSFHANFTKGGRAKLQREPLAGASDLEVLEAIHRLGGRLVAGDGERILTYFHDDFREALAPLAEELPEAFEAWMSLLLERVFLRFRELKAERGLRSYGDLVREALESRQATPKEGPALLLVDEYQDVNPIQEAFLGALGARRAVLVGDPKQAIYGFRGGVPELLQAKLAEASTLGLAFRLPANFRSAAPIVATANAFVLDVVPALDQASADPDGRQAHLGQGEGDARVGLAVTVPTKKRGSDLVACAPWIIAFARETGWREAGLHGLEGRRTRALLLPRRNGLAALRRVLHQVGVEPLVQSPEGFWESPGVRLLLALLEALSRPSHPVALLAVLRSPWVGATDPEWTDWWKRQELPSPKIAEGLAWLETLKPCTTQDLFAQALARPGLLELLSATATHGAMEPARAQRNLDALLSLSATLPAQPAMAFAALTQMRAAKDPGDAPTAAGEADLIIQTVHASKGLEYDDVILPMLADQVKGKARGSVGHRASRAQELWMGWSIGAAAGPALREMKAAEKQRTFREGLNLLYVALTRAKGRMALLQQAVVDKDDTVACPPPGSQRAADKKPIYWQHVAEDLRASAAPLVELPTEAPVSPRMGAIPPPDLIPPFPPVPFQVEAPPKTAVGDSERKERGIRMHALLRELLVREAHVAGAGLALLDHHPFVKTWEPARDLATWFLKSLEERGLSALPRRSELELPLATGGRGRADLVIWEPNRNHPERIHLLDFKLSSTFSEETLSAHREQLAGYVESLGLLHLGVPVQPWLIALEGESWVDPSKQIRVVAAVIQRNNRYLVCERPIHKRHGGYWEFPGGKLEPGENVIEATQRELAEELGVAVLSVGDQLFSIHDPGSNFVIEFHPVVIEGEPECLEHSALIWAALPDLLSMKLAPSDRKFAHYLCESEPSRG